VNQAGFPFSSVSRARKKETQFLLPWMHFLENEYPTLFSWKHTPSAKCVLLALSIDWGQHYQLKKNGIAQANSEVSQSSLGEEWSLQLSFIPGVLRYKFIVDGVWMFDPEQQTITEADGTINNFVRVTGLNVSSQSDVKPQICSPPPAINDQRETQKLLAQIERLTQENGSLRLSIEKYQVEMHHYRKLSADFRSLQDDYQHSQQELKTEKLEADKQQKDSQALARENSILKTDIRFLEQKYLRVAGQLDALKLENQHVEHVFIENTRLKNDLFNEMLRNKDLTEKVGLGVLKLHKLKQFLAQQETQQEIQQYSPILSNSETRYLIA